MKIADEMSLYLKSLYQESHGSCKELKPRYTNFVVFVEIYLFFFKISKVFVKMPVDGRNLNRVKPKKITVRNKRALLWTLQYLRNARKPFTVKTLRMQADLLHLSTCAINCCLNKHNYKYLQLRKNGLLTSIKNRKRLLFPRSVKKLREIF